MPPHTARTEIQAPLRTQAEIRLEVGTAPPAKVATTGAEALALLHRMATDPASAGAALKLLHELQVHQVELDLQFEQLEQGREELTDALNRYVGRYDAAPVGYFVVSRDGRLIEANVAAASLCGIEQRAMSGLPIDDLVATQSRPALLALLAQLREGSSRQTCEAQVHGGGKTLRKCRVVGTTCPTDSSLLLVFLEDTDSP